ncbi:MAG: DUF2141 domain-containing protein [Alphaproteobacteria bacterium]|nr:DUF2141 domain-containing protein [Alphaproteobacteria bacterium]
MIVSLPVTRCLPLLLGLALPLLQSGGALAEPPVCQGAPDMPEARITVPNVRSAKGQIVATVYGALPEDFLQSGKRVARERVPARKGVTTFCLRLPGPGTYAIAIYHDENGDRRLNRNLFGLPTEGYGFSNDAEPSLVPPGPPRHEDASFRIDGDPRTLHITLRY